MIWVQSAFLCYNASFLGKTSRTLADHLLSCKAVNLYSMNSAVPHFVVPNKTISAWKLCSTTENLQLLKFLQCCIVYIWQVCVNDFFLQQLAVILSILTSAINWFCYLPIYMNVSVWLACQVVRMLDLKSTGRGFKYGPSASRLHACACHQAI